MEDINTDVVDVPETPQAPEEVPETTQESEVSPEELRQQLEESEKKRAQLYERLKKAETQPKVEDQPAAPTQLGPKDYLALQQAAITPDDFDEVQEYANYRKVPVHEALKDTTLKTILANKAEERKTAQATQTKSPRGVKPNTGEDLLRRAEEGQELKSEADIDKLVKARFERRKAQSK